MVMMGMNEMYTQEVRSKGKPRICMKTFSIRKHLALEPRLDVLSQVVNSILEVLRNTATFITCLSGQV